MIRSNVGNITTNAMQTLNISATQYAKLRKKEDASTALNADRKQKFEDARLAEMGSKTELNKARAEELKSKTVARNARTERISAVGTPASQEIATKVDNDVSYRTERIAGNLITYEEVGGILIPKK